MPIACNPCLEANQRKGKVSVKQSQAPSLLSSSPLSTRCLSFIPFRSNPPFLSSLAPVCIRFLYVAQLRSKDGAHPQALGWAGWGRGGAADKGNPQDNWSGHGQLRTRQPCLFYPLLPWQTFALQLSSEASQQLTPTV